jgi:hypothetical protein
MEREDLRGTWAMEREAEWPSTRREELVQQALADGLESADSIRDRDIVSLSKGGAQNTGHERLATRSHQSSGHEDAGPGGTQPH